MAKGTADIRVMQFADILMAAFQQTIQRLQGTTQLRTGVVGTQCSFDRTMPSDPQDVTGVNDGSTAWQNVDQHRRWARRNDFISPTLLSRGDQLSTLVDPVSSHVRGGVMGMNRRVDKVIIDAVSANAAEGENGENTDILDITAPASDGSGGHRIPAGGTGMSVDKLTNVMETFYIREVGVDGISSGRLSDFTAIISGKQMGDLLRDPKATDWDFIGNMGRVLEGVAGGGAMPLVEGFVARLMGCVIVVSNQLPIIGSDRVCKVYHRNGMGVGFWDRAGVEGGLPDGMAFSGPFSVTVDRLPMMQNATGSIVQAHVGAVRVENKGVLEVLCQES